MSKLKVWILLVLCNLFWAGNYVIGKYVVKEITPLWITFLRWLLASVILFVIAYLLEKPVWKQVFRSWPVLALMGILGIVGYNMVLYSALNYTSPINAALVSALNPGVMVVFSVLFLREKISRVQILGIIVSLIGVFTILTGGHLWQVFKFQYNRGDLLMLLAIVMWTLYSAVGKRLATIPPITATAVSAFFAVLLMAPFAVAQGMDINRMSALAIGGILYITVFPSVCSFIFWNVAVREVGAGKSGIFLNLIPVFTAVISWTIGEKVTASQIIGGLIVFMGVYMTTGMLKYSHPTFLSSQS